MALLLQISKQENLITMRSTFGVVGVRRGRFQPRLQLSKQHTSHMSASASALQRFAGALHA